MKFNQFILTTILLAGLCSCETDESRIEKCNSVVNTFMANLPLDNYDILFKNYPNFKEIGTYWKFTDYKIENTSIDEDKSVSIICSTDRGKIFFNLEKIDNRYVIKNSKGLSSAFDTPLYKFCKKIGCLSLGDYDTDISRICGEKEAEFEQIINSAKANIESNVNIANNNLTINYGYVTGDITVKNSSRFTIPRGTYELYYHFLNSNGKVVFTKNEILNFDNIPFGQSVTHHLFQQTTGNFYKVRAEIKLTSTTFIEDIISEHIQGSNCRTNGDY